ncbi:endonuclease domain-containing protein [Microbacterium sp. NPDC058345]|uniref:endonuclease domain-containing protein n=1 Tax=Microbacterium sp. NPDC058345 TaxID=3346455 RepID=UPI0036492852
MRPAPLPPGTPRAFTVAAARRRGVSVGRLRAKDLTMPFHGTRARTELDAAEALRLLMEVLPAQAFVCGLTAGALWGMPLSERDERDAWGRPRIGVPESDTRIRRPEVVGHRLHIAPEDVVERSGIRTLSVPRTWIDLSRVLPLGRLVAVTDAVLSRRNPLADLDDLRAADARFRGGRGAVRRREALELRDDRAESPRESMVRVILVLAGLPRPECNVDIFDRGEFVARVDLLYRDAGVIVEYDGDYHRDPDQWSRDQIRRARLEAMGYRVTVVTRRDFDDPQALVARIRRLLFARR